MRLLARHGIARRGPAGRRSLAGISDRTVRAEVRKAVTAMGAARALGVDLATLVERLARMGLRPWPGGSDNAIAADYLAGATLTQVAATHGVSSRTVRRRLAASGVPMRAPGHPRA